MTDAIQLVIGLAAVLAMWDAARRWIAGKRANEAIWARILTMEKAFEERCERIERSENAHLQEMKQLASAVANAQRGGPPRILRRS